MDVAYTQHSNPARRKNRSTTNINHLSLAPLTSKLPINDHDELPELAAAPPSYLQGRSAPTTPRILSRSPAGRSTSRPRGSAALSAAAAAVAAGEGGDGTTSAPLPKSKSTSHLSSRGRRIAAGSKSGTASPRRSHHHRQHHHRHSKDSKDDNNGFSAADRNDSDWMLRAGALLSSEARESKGQAWLVSRASSTSLTGDADQHEHDAETAAAALEWELARERQILLSRRGSAAPLEDGGVLVASPPGSRLGSRSHSRRGSRGAALTPLERRSGESYFGPNADDGAGEQDSIPGPDFVGLDERLEAVVERDTAEEDEAHVRQLLRRGGAGAGGTWLGSVLGWQLSAVDEHDEEPERDEGEDDDDDGAAGEDGSEDRQGGEEEEEEGGDLATRMADYRPFGHGTALPEAQMPPPGADEGGWHDAAWLLSVASKVLL